MLRYVRERIATRKHHTHTHTQFADNVDDRCVFHSPPQKSILNVILLVCMSLCASMLRPNDTNRALVQVTLFLGAFSIRIVRDIRFARVRQRSLTGVLLLYVQASCRGCLCLGL